MTDHDYRKLKFSIARDLEDWFRQGMYDGELLDEDDDVPWDVITADSDENPEYDQFIAKCAPTIKKMHMAAFGDDDLKDVLNRSADDEIAGLYNYFWDIGDHSLLAEATHCIMEAVLLNLCDGKSF